MAAHAGAYMVAATPPTHTGASMRRHPTPLAAITMAIALAVLAVGCGDSDAESSVSRTPTSVVIETDDTATTTTTASESEVEAETADGADETGDESAVDDPADEAQETTTTTEVTEEADDSAPETYNLVEVASVAFPTTLIARNGTDDLWVAEREGQIRHLQRNGNGFDLVPEPTLDIADLITTDGEGGLLGMTFSSDGLMLYVSYTNNGGNSVVAEYSMNGDRADPDSARILLTVEQPFSNHNGGQVERGPDGLLYIGLGDGGSSGDPLNSGQDTSTLLGAILRIDPRNPGGDTAYGIPADNPFADGQAGRPEIWLYGVRNPWRFSFDRANGDLWIGDVGQNAVEEITRLPATGGQAGRGANLGWRLVEGNQSFDGGTAPPDHVAPIHTYGRDGGCSVTGGYVYRGQAMPELDGAYLFGDFCAGELIALRDLGNGSILVEDIVTDRGVGQIVSFAEDADGELYVLGASGSVSRLEAG